MKPQQPNGNGNGSLKSQAEKFLLARCGKLEQISRSYVKKLVNELHLYQIQLAAQHRNMHRAKKSNTETRNRAAEALQEERSQAQRYLDIAGVMIAVLNDQGHIILMNKKGCEILGYREEELVGRDWFEVCQPASLRREGRAAFERLMAGELANSEYYEHPVMTKDGREPLIAFYNTILQDQDSRITGVLFSGEDITERRQEEHARQWAEEALSLAAHKWRTTFDAIGDAVCLLDPDGRILQCNQAMMTLTGRSFDTILEHPCCEILDCTSQPLDDCPLLRMKQSLRREELILSRENRWIKETVDPIFDEAGTLIGGVYLATDITTAKNAEAALRESEARFRAIFDQAAVGVALVETTTGRFLKVNQKYCDIVGLPPDEMTAITFETITHPDDLQLGIDNTQKLRDGLIQNFTIEKRYCRKDGSTVWVNLTVSAMQEIAGPLKYHIAVAEDITQRRQAEIEVQEALTKLRQALRGTVGALANTVETKDPYTAGHQRRVAQLACAIAREMGLSPDQVEGMHVLSFLHDIGKIAVPAEILSRPGNISQIEFNLIRAHPEVGYNILKDLEFPWPVAQAVLQHHERLDGSGYPAGLINQDIIQEARILAVADVVEAMASHRPYRPALGIGKALDEVIKHKGKLFDSFVVEACVQLFKKGEFAFL
jgi:PAS domain S-box-containing protein/putative nucleotidyltransferase with HDIG domain